ncbi:MAG: hypothetical protein ACRD2I_08200, partial [Vicinamibacterales bacterium]
LIRRSERMNSPPMFDSMTILLADIHLYHPVVLRVWLVTAFFGVALLHARRMIDIGEAIALGSASMFVLLPDEPSDRILLVTVILMLITRPRWRSWWALSTVPASWLFIDYTFGLQHPLRRMTGLPGSWQHVVGANALVLVLALSYLVDRLRGRGRVPVSMRPGLLDQRDDPAQ